MYDEFLLGYYVKGTLLILSLVISLLAMLFAYRQKTTRLQLEKQKLELELSAKELEIGFEEREMLMTEVSHDVHDNIGQTAHFLRIRLHSYFEAETISEKDEAIINCGEITDKLISSINHLCHSMNTNFIKGWGLIGAIQYDIDHINASTNIRCDLDVDGDEELLSSEKQLMVYRIAQQAILNSLKHADAYTLQIKITFKADKFTMAVSDDGKGFILLEGLKKGMLGLSNMRHRAELLQGEITITSNLNKGTAIVLTLDPGKMRSDEKSDTLPEGHFKPF